MTDYQDQILQQMKAQTELLGMIVQRLDLVHVQLGRLEWLVAPAGPNYVQPLVAYATFDWESIGAEVTGRDRDGVSRVDWFGRTFTRRSGGGKFGKAIWFSRYVGEDEAGQKKYARLITFKDYSEAEPVSEAVANGAKK